MLNNFGLLLESLIMIKNNLFLLLALALPLCICGCGGNKNGTVPVVVTVTYNGSPVDEAVVVFAPENADGYAANGATDKSGVVKLSSFTKNDGAKPGKYLVTIEKVSMEEVRDPKNEDHILETKVTHYIPEVYGSRTQSGLTAEVVAGKKNVFTFELDDSRSGETTKNDTSID